MTFLLVNLAVSIHLPGTGTRLMVVLSDFIYIDALLVDQWLHPLLFSDDFEDEPLNQYFDKAGIDSQNVIKIMGSAIIYLGVISILLMLKLVTAKIGWIAESRVIKWLCKDVMWCGIFRLMMEQA